MNEFDICVILMAERLQTDVFNKQLYTEDFIQKVRAQRHRLLLLH